MDSYKYYIAKTGEYTFNLFVETKKDDKFLVIIGHTVNPIWGHKKKSCRCILRSFYNCVGMINLMKKDAFYRFHTIIKSGLIAEDLLIEKFPQFKLYEIQ